MQYRNQIIATGRITQTTNKEGFQQVKLVTKQPGTDSSMEVNMVCYSKMPKWCKDNPFVMVKGHTESITFKADNSQQKIRQRYVIDEIEPLKTLTMEAFGIEGHYYASYEFRAYISGKLQAVKDEDKWIRYTLYIEEEGKLVTIKLSQFKPEGTKLTYKANDDVCCVCTISTSTKKRKNGKETKYEDLIISDIAKLN